MTGRVANTESIWIWPFELTEKIGEGGMAAVYRARYVKDDRQVAVKLLPEETIERPASRARFQREMDVLKKLRHPNVVRCFGGLCENEQPFYAMELVEGGTLEDLLRRAGRRTWRTTAECGLQMCAALACAHSHGVVHRDVKPSNFLVDGDTLKLSDFGLALMASGAKLTAAGRTVGTFDYMAPEQIAGKPVTPRTDLYALGAVFFQMMTGRPPFESEERVAILHQHLRTRPPLVTDFAVDCPPDLERLVDDLLEKNPADRPKDADDVAERLQAILAGRALDLPPKPRPGSAAPRRRTAGPSAPSESTPRPVTRRERPESTVHLVALVGALTLLACVLAVMLWNVTDRAAPGPDAVDALLAATGHEIVDVRVTATHGLGPVAVNSTRAADRLRELAADADPFVRTTAINALAVAGPAAREALPDLMRLERHDAHPEVRRAAGETVRRLRTTSAPGSPWWGRGVGLSAFVLVVAAFSQWPRWFGTRRRR